VNTELTTAFPQTDDLTMSSLEIAELTGKRHDHVMCLVTGYKLQLRMAVIQRLRALEEGTATPWNEQEPKAPQLPAYPVPQTYADALRVTGV
jgi:phage regulator Rha-like protein